MKRSILILFTIHHSLFTIHYSQFTTHAQDIPPTTEQQLENLTDVDQSETEDDSYLLQLEQFRKNPVNLNTADAAELKELRIITDLQIENFLLYRRLLGILISIYELQAVPSWDVVTIRKLQPFVTIAPELSLRENFGRRFREGDHSLLLRVFQVLELSKGFDKSGSGRKYLGSPQRVFFRYRYSYKNLLQFGVVGDKDAGEQFLKGAQNKGFDFYSFHLFARKIGKIQALAIGDFTVNMGQGLIHWQSLAFKKSSDVMGIKRQSPVLRPYNSAGEFNFHRGAGMTINKGSIEATAFASIRNISANLSADTLSQEDFISSFLTSGYNRTAGEIANRNNLRQTTFGVNVKYRNKRFHVGINGIYYSFSMPLRKRGEPYNLYSLNGDNGYNLSVDYSYTYRNIHLFGEAAADKDFNKAFINGLLISVDSRVDISLLHRSIAASYQAVNGNSFTENTYPTNEKGMYAGITIRPAAAWRVDAYSDIYQFPWLKYLVDAPSYGRDFLAQVTYTPNKQVEVYTRYRNEAKQGNQPDNLPARQAGTTVTNYLVQLPRRNWRIQVSYQLTTAIALRNRVEMIWYDKKVHPPADGGTVGRGDNSEKGYLSFSDFIYKPLLRPWSGVIRLQYFETDGYNSRLYAYENDVLYSYSIPIYLDKGFRYYMTLNYDVTRKLSVWFRWAQTIYHDKNLIGSGLDEIQGNMKTEVKMQARYIF